MYSFGDMHSMHAMMANQQAAEHCAQYRCVNFGFTAGKILVMTVVGRGWLVDDERKLNL